MRFVKTLLIAGLVLASAAGSAHALLSPPVVEGQTEVQLWPGALPGQLVVIVTVSLDDSVELPATVRVPVPDGMNIDWAGEILPEGDPADDPQREYTLEQGSGGQYAQMEVSESTQAQVEFSGTPLTVNGSEYSAALRYVQTVPTSVVGFSVRLPAGASSVRIDPAAPREPDRNEIGETLYTLPSFELAPGDAQSVSVAYSVGGSSQAGGGTDTATIIGVLVALLAGAIVLLLFVMGRQRKTEQPPTE